EISLETLAVDNLTVGLTGGAFIQDLESDAVAFEGLFGTMIITAVLILIVLIIFLGSLKLPLLSLYPLFLGAIIASGFAYVIYGSINMFAVSFALLLLGLGIDFAVHLIVRYQEEKNEKSKSEAVKIAFQSTGTSIAIGGITTGFAFAAFTFAKFKAFEQMGIISAIGIICLLIVMLLLIPAIISVFDNKESKKPLFNSIPGVVKIVRTMERNPFIILVAMILMLVGGFFSIRNFELETSIDAIYPDNIPSLQWVDIIEEEFDYSTKTISTYADSYEDLITIQELLLERDDISTVDSILNYVPSDMSEKTRIFEKLNTYLLSYGISAFSEYTIREMTMNDFPSEIKDKYVGTSGKLRVDINSNIDIYNLEQYEQLSAGIQSITGKKPIGIPAMMNEISTIVEDDILRISLICLISVFILSLLLFKSVKTAIVTMIPLSMTLYFTIALLPILNIEVNIFSIAAFPLIIGISVDSVIHLLHRLKENDGNTVAVKTSRTGKAILLTTLTTVIGFGSLSQINHPGMANLGLTVVVGMIVSYLFTILLTPLLFSKILEK
ncbi:MAG: MMPL family transporter, partial [Firmicutes bacterium]|nr:MMPL family transporter [Bacillota bacterium]